MGTLFSQETKICQKTNDQKQSLIDDSGKNKIFNFMDNLDKSIDHSLTIDINQYSFQSDIGLFLRIFSIKLRKLNLYDPKSPHNLTIRFCNIEKYRSSNDFIKYSLIVMETAISFQNCLNLEVSFEDESIYSFNNTICQRTYIMNLQFLKNEDLLNKVKEYYLIRKNYIDSYYLNNIGAIDIEFIYECYCKIQNRIKPNDYIKLKDFFIYVGKPDYENEKYYRNLIVLFSILEKISLNHKYIILKFKFSSDFSDHNLKLISKIISTIVIKIDYLFDFILIFQIDSCRSNKNVLNYVKSGLKKLFNEIRFDHIYSSINLTFEDCNYKIVIDKNIQAFFNFLYSSASNQSGIKKIYKKKSVLLKISKFFFSHFELSNEEYEEGLPKN